MRLTLHYRGRLRANGSPEHKHELRRHFHAQLRTLWLQPPLSEYWEYAALPSGDDLSLIQVRGQFQFMPLVNSRMCGTAELNVTLLRPEPPGGLITRGGDIDNRLKTLFDSLAVPPHANALPVGVSPASDELPFLCLLEDDNLITSVHVRTEQLLEPTSDPSMVELFVHVRTRVTRHTYGNDLLA
jgi:hypothetical protein